MTDKPNVAVTIELTHQQAARLGAILGRPAFFEDEPLTGDVATQDGSDVMADARTTFMDALVDAVCDMPPLPPKPEPNVALSGDDLRSLVGMLGNNVFLNEAIMAGQEMHDYWRQNNTRVNLRADHLRDRLQAVLDGLDETEPTA